LRFRITLAGVIAIAVRAGGTVTRLAFDVIVPSVAVTETAVLMLVNTVATPVLPMLTTAGLEDAQVTDEVIVAFVPLLYVPVATYCCVPLRGKVTLAGVITIAVRTPETVKALAGEVIPPKEALMEIAVVLLPTTVASPALVILAAVGFELDHVTVELIFAVVPSV
jgi:hypothetical protein